MKVKRFNQLNEEMDYQGQWTVGRLKKLIENCPDDMFIASINANGEYDVVSFDVDDGRLIVDYAIY